MDDKKKLAFEDLWNALHVCGLLLDSPEEQLVLVEIGRIVDTKLRPAVGFQDSPEVQAAAKALLDEVEAIAREGIRRRDGWRGEVR